MKVIFFKAPRKRAFRAIMEHALRHACKSETCQDGLQAHAPSSGPAHPAARSRNKSARGAPGDLRDLPACAH
eukprot:6761901-Alexandrium_andersonii.AAC.1